MKKIFSIFLALLLVSCAQKSLKEEPLPLVNKNCNAVENSFYREIENTLLNMGEDIWIADREVFYSQKLQTCIGKYTASRREGGINDISLFVIKDIQKNTEIYFQKYTGTELTKEHEGQKMYQKYIAGLQ